MRELQIETVEYDSPGWRFLIEHSPQATPFLYQPHLEAVGYYTRNYLASYDGRVLGGLALPIRRLERQPDGNVPYASYHGLLFNPDLMPAIHSNYKTRLELSEALIEAAGAEFNKMSFRNHWTVTDIRGIDWYHYHEPEKGRFTFQIQYTAIVDIGDCDSIIRRMNTLRRRDYRKALKSGLRAEVMDNDNMEIFEKLYQLTFNRQGISIDDKSWQMVRNIVAAGLKNNYGRLVYAFDEKDAALSAIYILYDQNSAYYMFGANDPAFRHTGAGTFLLVEAMQWASRQGRIGFDMVGANSPLRGDFKLSFGAVLHPYYFASL
jgi:hypothetical protein